MATFKKALQGTAKWEDPEFPASPSSLSWPQYGTARSFRVPKNMKWMRPPDMGHGYPKEPKLYGSAGKPIPNGIAQGGLGDCWFLSAISSISEVPNRIERLIPWTGDYPKNGIFRMNFWVKDKWVSVNVDDRLPSRPYGNGGRPIFTRRSKGGSWYVPLMEKAYAKLDQNYDRIVGGNGDEGLRTLTGMPTDYISLKPKRKPMMLEFHKAWASK